MELIKDVEYKDVAKHLFERKIVAIFQGRSEMGHRALGNRSMLYTPIDPNGKDYVNRVKGREFFRPLAASVLAEYAKEWFDMLGFEESPYMSLSFRCKPKKRDIIPCVIHVDGSCRIQTVSQKQNLHYYNLIDEFYKLSGVPLILNTSFNLAGEPMVETVDDAFRSFANSKINFLYFPETNMLVSK